MELKHSILRVTFSRSFCSPRGAKYKTILFWGHLPSNRDIHKKEQKYNLRK